MPLELGGDWAASSGQPLASYDTRIIAGRGFAYLHHDTRIRVFGPVPSSEVLL